MTQPNPLLERPYSVQQSGADSWRWAVMLGPHVVLKRTRQSDAQAEADRLNTAHQQAEIIRLLGPLVEAAKRIDGPHKCPICDGFGEVAYFGEMVTCGCEKPFFADVTTDSRLALRQAFAALAAEGGA